MLEPAPSSEDATQVARWALVIVDVQNDFFQQGTLAVPAAEVILPFVNDLIARSLKDGAAVYASRDWHPAESVHFQAFGGRWPVHCVAGTPGAEFQPGLNLPERSIIVSKGQSGKDDGYSAFEGTVPDATALAIDLRRRGILHLYVAGVATDYCVGSTARDALKEGFRVTIVGDAIAGIDSSSSASILEELQQNGASLETTAQVASSLNSTKNSARFPH